MDFFGPREVVIGIGILVLIAVLLDGVRRVRQARNATVRMAPQKRGKVFEDDDDYLDDPLDKSQFPSGGPRVIGERSDEDIAQVEESIRRATQEKKRLKSLAPRQEHFDLEPPVSAQTQPHARAQTQTRTQKKPEATAKDSIGDILVMHLMASDNKGINGQKLMDAALAAGMRYGAKKIFHRYAGEDGSGEVLFSMANAMNPGTFDLSNMGQTTTLGVTFFMEPAALQNPLESFEMLTQTVDKLSGDLELKVLDETRSSMTRQTFDHYRQRARDASRTRSR